MLKGRLQVRGPSLPGLPDPTLGGAWFVSRSYQLEGRELPALVKPDLGEGLIEADRMRFILPEGEQGWERQQWAFASSSDLPLTSQYRPVTNLPKWPLLLKRLFAGPSLIPWGHYGPQRVGNLPSLLLCSPQPLVQCWGLQKRPGHSPPHLSSLLRLLSQTQILIFLSSVKA